MTPTTLRRVFLVSLVLATVLICLYGCAGEEIHGYRWVKDDRMPRCEVMVWHTIPVEQLSTLQQSCPRTASPIACAVGCVVFSYYSESQARLVDQWGESLYDHEARHVLQRMKHPS